MNVVIVGTGYVGLVSGTCFAEMGMHVQCVDVDTAKIERLKKGEIPIYEPGLDDMVERNSDAGRLTFTTSLPDALTHADILFIAVGTPTSVDGSADLQYVLQVAKTIGEHLSQYCLVVDKSTVPVGTAKLVRQTIQAELDKRGVDISFDVASNPEFLKEGDAIKDFMTPDRVVVGVDSEKAKEVLSRLYRPFLLNNFRVIFMDVASAEMTKYAANAMLATRISFMNDIANLCDEVGADINMVRKGIGSDARIGSKFLYAGSGYGGSCFPKDVKALIKTGNEYGIPMKVLQAVESVNESQKTILFRKLQKYIPLDTLKGATVAVWGLSFKPNTDDMREAPSVVLIKALLGAGCKVKVYDPIAMEEAHKQLGDTVYYASDIYDAVKDAEALCLVTEWKEFRAPKWSLVRDAMKGNVIIDGRNIYDGKELREEGFVYEGIGVK
ncbi:MAG TPA: UDP-glucose/GDP-mannose dehydrogenase family protein [Paludibacteraceae bacterium]|nr:UDP-glucose/GDP-mannose dehydrogenase family protein [Paludibacteraceae bacterium]HQB68557.1 UDP-glucose/GDP-mannose dehydrogenase family protein [Paludibacteraceae bacterium]HRS67058.1 UDP-glucose/GDP-mannose dehydrogenase family protein [Paludibacteraceae bacterium]